MKIFKKFNRCLEKLLYDKKLYSFAPGVLAFLLFTERLPVIIEGPTSLNYYWVPLLVRADSKFGLLQ